MSSYFLIQINVTNKENYKEYIEKVTPIVKKYQGEYIVRGGKWENVEGEWDFERTVIIKFPTYDLAKKWHGSEDYKPIKNIREKNSIGNAIIIEGNQII